MGKVVRVGWFRVKFFVSRLIDVKSSSARRDVQSLVFKGNSVQVDQVTMKLSIA